MASYEKDYMGKISWSRLQCGGAMPLFGSDIKTDHPICVRINKAEIDRTTSSYNCDAAIFEHHRPFIEVMLTPVQWAEFLTAGNCGGVPCTITQVDGKQMSSVEETNGAAEFDADFKTAFDKTAHKLAAYEKNINDILASGKTMNKTQMKDLAQNLKWAREGYLSDIDYIRTRFTEDMAGIVAKAKAEVSAYVQTHIGESQLALNIMPSNEKSETSYEELDNSKEL